MRSVLLLAPDVDLASEAGVGDGDAATVNYSLGSKLVYFYGAAGMAPCDL
ncbi:hypothetical protein HMPREF3227_00214 [Corynebacterium sp. CMW7794]|nr:hypothetical protein HMPREF3227_00214 [Corynebacterium sp. CMW7794]